MMSDLRRLAQSLPDEFDHADVFRALFSTGDDNAPRTLPLFTSLGADAVKVGEALVREGLAVFVGQSEGRWSWSRVPGLDFANPADGTSTSQSTERAAIEEARRLF